jgi:ribonucleotide reductase alpha subunit
LLHPSDPETKAYTLEDLGGHVFDSHGISVGLATLSEWHSWYALKRRMEMAAERADQARLELAKDPSISPEDIERVAQTVFTAETLQSGDVESYVKLAALGLKRRALDHDARKLKLMEEKSAAAKAAIESATAKAKAGGGISEETLRELEEAAKLL